MLQQNSQFYQSDVSQPYEVKVRCHMPG